MNIVRNKLPEVEIHALAKNGLDTIQQIQMLENLVEKGYVLDTVVLVYCMNDIGSLDAGLRDGLRTIVANEEPPLIRDSFLLDLIYNRMSVAGHHEISEYNENLAELYAGETWSQQAKWLRYMKIFVEDHGGQLVVVTFPMIGVMGDDYIFADAHEKLGEFWKNNDIPHLDLFPAFEQYSPRDLVLNRFDAHPNTEAHAIAAGAILKFIDNIENELYE